MRLFTVGMFLSLVYTVNLYAARIEVLTASRPNATPSVHHNRDVRATPCNLEIPTRSYTVGKGGDDDIKIPEGEDISALITGVKVGSQEAWTLHNVGKRSIAVFLGTKLVKNLNKNDSLIMKFGDLYKIGDTTYLRLRRQ